MKIPMISVSVPMYLIDPTFRALIESALPTGYALSEQEDGSYAIFPTQGNFNVTSYSVGTARVEGREVVFEIRTDNSFGPWLADALKKKFPECDLERVVWGVFIEWCGAYTAVFTQTGELDGLVEGLGDFELGRNPVLCSLYTGDMKECEFMTLTSQKVTKDRVILEDKGPMRITLTNLETCVGSSSESPTIASDLGFDTYMNGEDLQLL